eukprot:746977-Hanusia_phi.AAC.6
MNGGLSDFASPAASPASPAFGNLWARASDSGFQETVTPGDQGPGRLPEPPQCAADAGVDE